MKDYPEVIQQFKAVCEDCSDSILLGLFLSAGAAEEAAKNHIEFYTPGQGSPNYYHTVQITVYTLVGRNI